MSEEMTNASGLSEKKLPLQQWLDLPEIADISADPSPMRSSLHGLLDREHDGLHPKNKLRIGFFVIDYVENVGVVFTTFHMRNLKIEPLVVFVRINIRIQNKVVLSAT
jgi:hypothetical protein